MPDLRDWISQQIDEREALACRATKIAGRWVYALEVQRVLDRDYVVANTGSAYGQHIEANSPAVVIRRCAADRKIVELHCYGDDPDITYEPYACRGCGYSDMGYLVDHCNDCETLLALAEGYGITDEILADLDRPEAPRREATGKPLGEALAEAFDQFAADRLEERFLGDLSAYKFTGLLPIAVDLLPPTPLERALDILNPHLRDQPLYRKENALTARDDLLQTFADWFLTTGRGSREIADRILATHAHELAEKIRAEAPDMGADEYGSYQNVLEAADLIDPPKEA